MHLKKLKLRVDLVLSNIAFESLNIHFPSVKDFPSPPFLKRKEKSFSLTSWQLSAWGHMFAFPFVGKQVIHLSPSRSRSLCV